MKKIDSIEVLKTANNHAMEDLNTLHWIATCFKHVQNLIEDDKVSEISEHSKEAEIYNGGNVKDLLAIDFNEWSTYFTLFNDKEEKPSCHVVLELDIWANRSPLHLARKWVEIVSALPQEYQKQIKRELDCI